MYEGGRSDHGSLQEGLEKSQPLCIQSAGEFYNSADVLLLAVRAGECWTCWGFIGTFPLEKGQGKSALFCYVCFAVVDHSSSSG